MNITGGENFYEKLMILKKEQAEHIKLVERVYFKELSQNNTKQAQLRPSSILKKPQQNTNMVNYLLHLNSLEDISITISFVLIYVSKTLI